MTNQYFNPAEKAEMENELKNYLKQKGKIKAALFYKLEKEFRKRDISNKALIIFILKLLKKRKIDILLPKLYKKCLRKTYIKGSKHLEDGYYFTSNYKEINDLNINDDLPGRVKDLYYFDTRKINKIKSSDLRKLENFLLKSFKKSLIKKRLIILLRPNNYARIFKKFEIGYDLNWNWNKKVRKRKYKKIKISQEKQKSNIEIIKNYRKKNMCFYIPLIEAIHQKIIKVQKNLRVKEGGFKELKGLIRIFAFYCTMFGTSSWIEIEKPNPYKWETFFKTHKLPIKIINISMKSLKFYEKIFEAHIIVKFCIFIDSKNKILIKRLNNYGYKVLDSLSSKTETAIGSKISVYLPCPAIEYFFFIVKYICYYHLFLLLSRVFAHLDHDNDKFIYLNKKEKEFYKLFIPVLKPLFNLNEGKIQNKYYFNYFDSDVNILEILLNHFLIPEVKRIELTLFRYFIIQFQNIHKNSHNSPLKYRKI